MRWLIVIVLALAVGVGPAVGAGSATSTASRHAAVAKTKSKHCAKRVRRCRVTYRMSAKRLYPVGSAAGLATPVVGGPTPAPGIPTTRSSVTTTPPAPPPPGPVASTVGANAFDMGGFVLRLTRTSVQAGNLTVFFTNHDVSEHNLWIEGADGVPTQISDAVGENASANATVPVSAGTWRLYCSLPGHEAMTRDLLVTP